MSDVAEPSVLKALPKVSLHDRLDGGLRPATILELADAHGIELPGGAPVGDAEALGAWFAEKSDSGALVLKSGWMRSPPPMHRPDECRSSTRRQSLASEEARYTLTSSASPRC